jgi:hypothetical protein
MKRAPAFIVREGRAKLFIALVFLNAAAATCFARLGETMEECQARYGAIMAVETDAKRGVPIYCFQKDDVKVRTWFLNGRSACETFGRDQGKLGDMYIADILAGSSEGSTWNATKVGDATSYARADGKATARHMRFPDLGSDVLMIETVEFERLSKGGTGF